MAERLACAGFVLAGGQSQRMGRDKALLELHGEVLIARAVRMLSQVCETVAIVGERDDLARFAPVIADRRPGCGPLGALDAVLAETRHEWNVLLAVDVPWLPAAVLRWLVGQAMGGDAAAVVPMADGRPQSLAACYSRGLLLHLQSSLDAGRLAIFPAIERAAAAAGRGVAVIDVAANVGSIPGLTDAERAGTAEWFTNLNTPEEFERASRREGSSGAKLGGR